MNAQHPKRKATQLRKRPRWATRPGRSPAARINIAEAENARVWSTTNGRLRPKNFHRLVRGLPRNPEFFKRVRQMTALERVYANAQEKILEPHQISRELRLQL